MFHRREGDHETAARRLPGGPKSEMQWLYAAMFRSAQHAFMMHGLLDVDVTRARAFLREHLILTISFDHDIIGGAPEASFTRRLKELVESDYGIFDSMVESELVRVEGASMQTVEATRTALP